MEGNLANEVGLIVLDSIELFCNHFKVRRYVSSVLVALVDLLIAGRSCQ